MYNFFMKEDIKQKLAKRLKYLRKKYNYTQRDLSEKSGIDYKHIQLLESKSPSAPTLVTLEKLARAFKISVSKLLDF